MTDKTRTNETRCLLASPCKLAGGPSCNDYCPPYIQIHGHNGKGGRVGAAGLPAEYRLLTLDNSPAREGQAEVYRTLTKYVATFERQFDEEGGSSASSRSVKSLYLWSESPGTGKTTTASALLNEWIRTHYIGAVKRGQQPLQQPTYFLDVNAWQELYTGFTRSNIPQAIAEENSRPYYRQLELAKTTPFVVLDDIGVRSASDGFRGDLHTVINHRCANGLPTVYTSNLPIKEMADVFDARLYDRMRDQCADLHFVGESKRGRR